MRRIPNSPGRYSRPVGIGCLLCRMQQARKALEHAALSYPSSSSCKCGLLSSSHGQHHFVLCPAPPIRRGRLPCGFRDGPPDLSLLLGWNLRQHVVKPLQDRLLKTEVVVDRSPFECQHHWFSMHRSEASLCEELLQPM